MDYNIIQGEAGTVSYVAGPPEAYSCTLSVAVSALGAGKPYTDKGLYLLKTQNANATRTPTLNINGVGAYPIVANGSNSSTTIQIYQYQIAADSWAMYLWDQSIGGGTGAFIYQGTNVVDSGWQNLSGFSFMSGFSSTPQFRVIGKTINFRGTIVVPLDNGSGSVIPFSAESSYITQQKTAPYTGVGGVKIIGSNPSGGLQFNNNGTGTAQSVLPSMWLPDGTYRKGYWVFGQRRILAQGDGVNAIMYNNTVVIYITSGGILIIQTVIDGEQWAAGNPVGNSPLRFVNSNVIAGQYALDYRSVLSKTQTNGALVIGGIYTIASYGAGDVFTNVGAASNAAGVVFVATGTSPATWSNGSVLGVYPNTLHGNSVRNGLILNPNVEFLQDPTTSAGPALIHPCTIDAATADQLGGWYYALDGLTAYLT